ncbi:aminoglycoside phosphotransferase family protein [Singulisphaera acidiphila]|uniref:Putative aminoglycoside phosphotransferase n=1 Tax=Singulisphaera acidiphila (strain ATCC BAA-1392 / DSM 18658 / VKM B-2454 / MOB10) TaxID=886293 RepID=L0DMH7_SINAD|nr:aminoglycoside phosphotransferase family protein [Singulisphaera acidiphila]AGA30030.1 putative aminoglycoside phosphotransferase [Singulisphaera acidiphila DSM 18658]
MHKYQVRIDTDTARDLIYNQFPLYRNRDIIPVETSGTVNAIFRIGSDNAARFPLRRMEQSECVGVLRAEVAAMSELLQVCPFPTPRPTGLGKPGPRYPMPWTIQTWIEGQPATPGRLSGSTTFAVDLVRLVTSLRQANVAGRRFDGRGRGGNLRDHDDWMNVCFFKSEDLLDVVRLRRIWTGFRDLPYAGPVVMSHKDLIPANLLVQDDRLVGVLDGGDFGPADASLDLVVAWHLLDRERRTEFLNAIQAGDLEWQRGAAWAFQQAMGLVWYYYETNPAMRALGRSTISRLLEEFPA